MLALFRHNTLINSLALLVYTALMRSFSFFQSESYVSESQGILSHWLFGQLHSSSLSADILGIVLVFFQAVMINRYVIVNRLAQRITLFPGVFYVLLTAMLPCFQQLSAELLANTFVIAILPILHRTYRQKQIALQVFNAGFLLGLASLFHSAYGILIIWVIVFVAIMNSVNFKRVIQVLVGYLVPISWSLFACYWQGDLETCVSRLGSGLGFLSGGTAHPGSYWWIMVFFGVLLIWTLLGFGASLSKRLIRSRKGNEVLYWLLLFGGVVALFMKGADEFSMLLAFVPLSILMSFKFSDSSYESVAELGHFMLFVLLVFLNAYLYFG